MTRLPNDVEADTTVPVSVDEAMNKKLCLSPIPAGLDHQKANRDRKIKLPTHPVVLPRSRKEVPEYHMNLQEHVRTSNMGVNGESEFLNFVMTLNSETYLDPRLYDVPLDMMPLNAVLLNLLMEAIMKQSNDRTLIREVTNLRQSRWLSHGSSLTCRILLSVTYNSLGRASANVTNLANKKHFLNLQYLDYKDAYMEDFLDEFTRRCALCDDLTPADQEGHLQMCPMDSVVLEDAMSEYLLLPIDGRTIESLLGVINAEIAVRSLKRRNRYEVKLYKDNFKGNVQYDAARAKALPGAGGGGGGGGGGKDANKGGGRNGGRHGGGKGGRKGGGNKGGGKPPSASPAVQSDPWHEEWYAAGAVDGGGWQLSKSQKKKMKREAKKANVVAAQDGGSQSGNSSAYSHGTSTQAGGSRPGYDSNGNRTPCWLYQTVINGGYKCEGGHCIFDHKKVDWNTMLKTMRPPKWVCIDYQDGKGKSTQPE